MIHVVPQQIEAFLKEAFKRYGASDEEADEISAHLVISNLRGNDSHGVMRAPWYMEKIQKKEIIPGAPIKLERETPSSAVIDGNWGFGQPIAKFAIQLAIQKAKKNVVSCVTVKNCNHVGRIGAYTVLAAKEGMIGIGMANLHGTSHVVAPFGGIDPKLPTNPLSIAFPTGDLENFLLDMSTSMVAEGTLKMKLNKKERVPEGWIIDFEGNPTEDPKKFYEVPRGSLLPLGGLSAHKGFALSLAIDALSGALSGAQCSNSKATRHGNAGVFIVVKIEAFTALTEFKEKVGGLSAHVKSSRKAKGCEEILLPGEPEARQAAVLEKTGFSIDETTWAYICKMTEQVGVSYQDFDQGALPNEVEKTF